MPHAAHASRSPRPRLYNIVTVRFRTNFIRHDFDARSLPLRQGDEVIVETSRGPVIARVEGQVTRRLLEHHHVPRVVRRATAADLDQAERNEERESSAYRFALERIRTRRLPMKLVRTQYVHDGSKVVFYFSADGRIDFRDLVKDLAHRFRTRIEMHQIGVRDGARMIGGIGPCGRELCCSTFLEQFAPVSIRMAKDQGLTLNPKKVSGMCGRLMCCLVYEQQVYKRMRRRLPRPGTTVYTEEGQGVALNVDVINERVTVELEDTTRRVFQIAELSPMEIEPISLGAEEDQEPDYLWDDLLEGLEDEQSELLAALDQPDPVQRADAVTSNAPSPSPRHDEAPQRPNGARRRRRRSNARSVKSDRGADASGRATAQSDQRSGDQQPAPSRRRRRRGRSSSSSGHNPSSGTETPEADPSRKRRARRRRRGKPSASPPSQSED